MEIILKNFRQACKNGNIIFAKQLKKDYNLTINDARSNYNKALRQSCKNGYTNTAKWLVVNLKVSTEDA